MPGLLLDLDGTLVDSSKAVLAAFQKGFEAVGFPLPATQKLLATIGKKLEDIFSDFLKGDVQLASKAVEAFRGHYEVHLFEGTGVYPGVTSTLKKLSEKGIPLALTTMKKDASAKRILDHFGWSPYFRAVLGPDCVKHPKPHPEMLKKALTYLEIPAHEAWMVGDTATDATMAAAANVPFAWASWGYGSRPRPLQPKQRELTALREIEALF